MEEPILRAKTLGQLLLMQSILAGLPDEKSIFSFACRGLRDIPGVTSVYYTPDPIETETIPGIVRLPLAVGTTCLGELVFELSDPAAFAPYHDYLNNFSFMMAVILEERNQRSQNQSYQSRLENMVEDRTFRLREEIAKNKAIENTLRQSEKLLNDTQAISRTGGWEYDVARGKFAWSAETYRIHEVPENFDPNDIESNIAFYEPGCREIIRKAFSSAVTLGESYDLVFPFTTGRGSAKWVRTMGQAEVRDGRVVRVFGNIIDITEQKKAQIKVHAASQLWRSTFDAMLDPVAYLATDGRVEKCNRAFADHLGLEIKTIKGRKCHELIHGKSTHIDGCPLTRALQSKAREIMELETDKGVLFIAVDPVKDTDGQIIGFVHIMRDVTQQRRAQQALEESKKRYQLVAETTHDLILTTDLDYQITFANKAVYEFLKGIDPLGLKINDFTPPAYRPTQEDMMTRRRKGESDVFSFEWEVTDASRRSYILDVRSQLLTVDGNPTGVLFVARDITERKKAEEERIKLEKQLFDAQKMEAVGTLAGGIAHDFNNILAAIMGYADLLSDEDDPRMRKENIGRLLMAAERAKDLVNQILAFSRRVDHDKKPIDLRLIVKEEIKLLRATMPKTIEIRQNIPNTAFTIFADTTQMHQVVMNLCTNAASAMGEKGGVLSISLSKEIFSTTDPTSDNPLTPGTYVKISISDTGPGIETDVINRIFEPFFTTKKVGEGTGLGLAVVYGIVKNHSGIVQVESIPGGGATFHVYIPFLENETRHMEILPEEGIARGKESILFIDDETDLIKLAKASLGRLGYQVTAISDSREALTLFQTHPDAFDLIITDMTMPHLPGSDLARAILKLRPEQSIILCTGYSSYIDAEKAARMGIKSFLLKPVSTKDLAAAVRKTLDKSRATVTPDR
jgi:PAS domain S-box-containing protein